MFGCSVSTLRSRHREGRMGRPVGVSPDEELWWDADTIWAASPAGSSKSSGRRPHHGHPGHHSWATGRLGGDATTPFP